MTGRVKNSMSKVVLESAEILKPLEVIKSIYKKTEIYEFQREFQMLIHTNRGDYLWTVLPPYTSNCGSIPWLGQKVLRVKSFDPDNNLQNAFFFFHDDLYQKKGYNIFNRGDSDALCRGGLREAGLSRFQASTIDFFLMLGAWGHWGDNEYHNRDCLSSLVPCK
jgi:hypothetical protein